MGSRSVDQVPRGVLQPGRLRRGSWTHQSPNEDADDNEVVINEGIIAPPVSFRDSSPSSPASSTFSGGFGTATTVAATLSTPVLNSIATAAISVPTVPTANNLDAAAGFSSSLSSLESIFGGEVSDAPFCTILYFLVYPD